MRGKYIWGFFTRFSSFSHSPKSNVLKCNSKCELVLPRPRSAQRLSRFHKIESLKNGVYLETLSIIIFNYSLTNSCYTRSRSVPYRRFHKLYRQLRWRTRAALYLLFLVNSERVFLVFLYIDSKGGYATPPTFKSPGINLSPWRGSRGKDTLQNAGITYVPSAK